MFPKFIEVDNSLLIKYDEELVKEDQANEDIKSFPVLINANGGVVYNNLPITIDENSSGLIRNLLGSAIVGVLTNDGNIVIDKDAIPMIEDYSGVIVKVGNELYIRKKYETSFTMWDRVKEPKIDLSYKYSSYKNSNVLSYESSYGVLVLKYISPNNTLNFLKVESETVAENNDHLLVLRTRGGINSFAIFNDRIEVCNYKNKYIQYKDPITESPNGVLITYFVKGNKKQIDSFRTYNLSKCENPTDLEASVEHFDVKLYEKK